MTLPAGYAATRELERVVRRDTHAEPARAPAHNGCRFCGRRDTVMQNVGRYYVTLSCACGASWGAGPVPS